MKPFLTFPLPMIPATFLARPQRFLITAKMPDGTLITAYCANPGSFKDCLTPGSPILLWDSQDATRKRRYTLRAIKLGRHWVGTDTHLANRLVEKALLEKRLPGMEGYDSVTTEPRDKKGARLDFHLTGPQGQCFLEVKSATVVSGTCARYPDSKTLRTLAQLRLLASKAKTGHRAVLLFLIQRGDVDSFAFNRDCDPALARAFDRALAVGVEMLAVKHHASTRGFSTPCRVPVTGADNNEASRSGHS